MNNMLEANLDVRLALTLGVLQRAVQQQNARILDAASKLNHKPRDKVFNILSAHLGVGDILVDHDAA